jgi:hypothetical protein
MLLPDMRLRIGLNLEEQLLLQILAGKVLDPEALALSSLL